MKHTEYTGWGEGEKMKFWAAILWGSMMMWGGVVFADSLRVGGYVEGKVWVIDGDSLKVRGEEVRLQGIDAMEFAQKCGGETGESWSCGKRAYEELKRLTRGKMVRCDIQEKDKYGRWIGVCVVKEGEGKQDLAQEMVLRGFAVALPWFTERYVRDEGRARSAGVGIWGDVFERPGKWRKREMKK